ncbi:AraC family transcriptional regulator [Anaeromicropila herbilytica]|uniref:AraC family transcriptional regulator n=1 Tax=Anaeromicropila herbilytica TaxID=2785025 RepID=A0A7R7EJ73_9FIRM|nr:AraC family transcriptional regulator [Anaeromicropila herbilytica]BCN29417.1 AraC family transcriptional regulator [Anaeromicropila herbilytica]
MEYIKLSMQEQDLISGVGYLKQSSVAETYPMHTHDFYEVFFILDGKAIHNVNNEIQLLVKGSFVFIRPEDCHRYSFFNSFDMKMISCAFSSQLIMKACEYLNVDVSNLHRPILPYHIVLEGSEYWEIEKKLNMIGKKEIGEERRQYFLSILPWIIYKVMESENQQQKVLPIWFRNLLEKMDQKENYISGLKQFLSISGVSQEHLTRECRRYLGMSPTEYVNMKRLNYAAELLLERKYEILDICYMCGYNNVGYFYKVFKKQFQCTPYQFTVSQSTD